MTRIYTNNGEVYQGVLIAEYNHNIWWWDSSDEYSYALFIENDFQEAPYDKSIKIFSSLDVSYIKSSNTYLNISEYDDFLKNNDMTLDLPLKDDVFVVVGNEGYHLEESGYGDFAYDFIKNDEYGNSYQNDGINNEDYFAWNEPVYLPVDGEVFEIHDGNKDNIPGEYVDESEANMVGIRLKGSYFVYLLHFKENTIPMQSNYNCERDIDDVICINVGDELKAGTYIGRVGNSGVSLVPHLHLTMFSYNSYTIEDVRMWSIPSLFKNIELLNGDPSYYDFYRPKTGDIISNMDNAIP
jgi:hypothetical protein